MKLFRWIILLVRLSDDKDLWGRGFLLENQSDIPTNTAVYG